MHLFDRWRHVTWALASFTTFVGIAGLVMIMLCSFFPCPVAVVEFTIDDWYDSGSNTVYK